MKLRVLMLAVVTLVLGAPVVNAQSISVDHIDGLAGPGAIQTDVPVTFHIRMEAGGTSYLGITNGFRVYSPTGATWTTLTADTTGTIGGAQFDLLWLINYYGVDGMGADTVGFAGSIFMMGTGMPADFNDITHTITMGPVDAAYTGGEICLDSSYYPPSGLWKWASGSGDQIPNWDGPHCFTIGEAAPEPPVITCPTPDPIILCGDQEWCLDMPIANADEVTVTGGGTWSNDQFCFNTETTAPYEFRVIATNTDGADTCDLALDVTVWMPPQITCPPAAIDISLCNAEQVNVPLEIVLADGGVEVDNGGSWAGGNLFFMPDTSGTYIFNVVANGMEGCGWQEECQVIVNVDINSAPTVVSHDITVDSCNSVASFYYTPDDPDADDLTETLVSVTGPDVLLGSIDTVNNLIDIQAGADGQYTAVVRVQDPCGAFDEDTVTVMITRVPELVFDAPSTEIDVNLCDVGQVCVPFTIANADLIDVSYGEFIDNQVCFQADTAGSYAISVSASNDCSEMVWNGTVNVAIGAAPSIACITDPIMVDYAAGDTACVDLLITGFDNVVIEHANVGWDITWSAGQLCFNTSPAGTYNAKVIATSDCGADTCDLVIEVQECAAPSIVCPEGPMAYEVCGPIEICEELLISNFDSVVVTGGAWADGFFCFSPDTAGQYVFGVYAYRGCASVADSCELTFDVTIADQPMIACPDGPIQVPVSDGEVCVPLVIDFADDVIVSDVPGKAAGEAYWVDGQLCFDASIPGEMFLGITAVNNCGEDYCEVHIIISDCQEVAIECPPDTVEVMLCEFNEGCEVCIDLPITGAVDVTVTPDIGYWYEGQLCFWADTLGTYDFNVVATGGGQGCPTDECDLVVVVKPYVFECSDILLSDSVFYFSMSYLDVNNPDPQYLTVGTSDEPFCFDLAQGGGWTWLTVPDSGCTDEALPIMVNGFDLQPGHYEADVAVIGDPSEICEPTVKYFTVVLDILPPVSDDDIIAIPNVPAVPGVTVAVPIGVENVCDLLAVDATFDYNDTYFTFDSATFGGAVVEGFDAVGVTEDGNSLTLFANADTASPAPAGAGLLVTLWFKADHLTPAGFYPITGYNALFQVDCFGFPEQIEPTVLNGGIVVGQAENYLCGYVVDPDMNAIEGATVEYWADYPMGMPEATTLSDPSGLFEFFDATISPFDLHAYKTGYYPATLEDLVFTDIGIIIILTPIEEVIATDMWVNFYCGQNTLNGEPFPVGTIVDAYDPDGVHCGSFTVTEIGAYGFMPVYHDDPYTAFDEGAEAGDIIRIYVNGIEANPSDVPTWTGNGDVHEICLDVGSEMTESCDIMEGWNLVSWSVDTDVDDITALFAAYTDKIDVVLGFEQGGLTWDPDMPLYSTLHSADHLSGYWIKANTGFTLEITGMPVPKTTPIPVTEGWNLVSYLPDYTLNTEAGLATVYDDLIVALGFDMGFMVHQPGDDLHNTLNEMGPCHGYWVKVDHYGQLSYPGAGPRFFAPTTQSQEPLAKLVDGVNITRNWVDLYAANLTLDGQTVPAGSEITALNANGQVIGRFELAQDGLFGFMPVYGVDETSSGAESVNPGEAFTLAIDGVETTQEFVWTENGDQIEVGPLTAKSEGSDILPHGFELSQNYPNPFNPRTTIGFSLPQASQARIEVYNILGRLVATPFDDRAAAGYNEVQWDGRTDAGVAVSSGVYFYRLTTENHTETRKMTLLK